MSFLRWLLDPDAWSLMANISLAVGLPFTVGVYAWERRKARQVEMEELYQRLSDEYTTFMKLVLENSDLGLLRRGQAGPGEDPAGGPAGAVVGPIALTGEQLERRYAMMDILVSLFERAYILVYEERMDAQTARLWQSWEDYMREWCRRAEFREVLPSLLRGEDPAFAAHITGIAAQETAHETAGRGR